MFSLRFRVYMILITNLTSTIIALVSYNDFGFAALGPELINSKGNENEFVIFQIIAQFSLSHLVELKICLTQDHFTK